MSLLEDIDQILTHWKIANPDACHRLGIHDYDNQINILTEKFIENRIKELITDLDKLESIEQKYQSKSFEKFEIKLIKLNLQRELFELRDRQEFRENPLVFIGDLTVVEGSYTKRSFAPIERRIDLIINFEEHIPKILASAEDLLKESLAQVKVSMSLQFLEGIINFYKNDLESFIFQTNREEIKEKWIQINKHAVSSMEDFKKKLQEDYLPKTHTKFALGKEKFLELLQKQESFETDLPTLLKIGEEDLEKNYQKMLSILEENGQDYLTEIFKDTPAIGEVIDYAKITLGRAKKYVVDSGIASVPTDEQCDVIPTPEFARKFAFAAMSTPGPFEVPEASEAYYWVSPPDKNWPLEQQQNYMKFFNKAFFELVTIHEAWPGHYLQLLFNKKSKSTISKLFARSTSMIEGWAHYAEEMVVDEGYARITNQDETKLKVGQLLGALVRDCRYVAAIKMHCYGMTVDEAKKLFLEKGFMPEQNAEIEARRGTIDPMYLNYTLGKLLIKKLRDDYKTEKGSDYSLRKFHDELLSFGSPPIIALREIMLSNSDKIKEVL